MKNYKMIRIGIALAGGIIFLVFHFPGIQELVLQLGEGLKGTSLRNPDKWKGLMEQGSFFFAVILFSISFALNKYDTISCLPKDSSMTDFCLGFPKFILENIPLVILITIATLAIHGIKLGEQVIPIDTEIWLDDRTMNWKEIGRFSLILLQGLTTFMGQNHYLVNFFSIFLLIASTLTWCYLLWVVSGWQDKFIYFAFSVVYCTSPIWVDILYFTCLSLEVSLAMTLVPAAAYLLFAGLTKKYPLSLVFGCLILFFVTGMYQSLVVVFCCGLLVCSFFFFASGKHSPKETRLVFLKGIICIVLAVLGYFVVDKILQSYVFNVSPSDYLINQSHVSPLRVCAAIPVYLFRLLQNWPMELLLVCLLFPVLFVQDFFKRGSMEKIIVFFIVMTMFAFPLVTGGGVSFRVQLMEPVVMGFVAFMVFGRLGKGKQIFKGIFLAICLFQIQEASLVNYTDYLRYQQDKIVAHDINQELQRLECGGLPVVLCGGYFPQYHVDHKKSEVSGHSIFEWDKGLRLSDSTLRGLAFMKAMGFYYHTTQDESLIQKARLAAESMVDYPSPGFVQSLGDVVVVRLSESFDLPE